MAATLVKAKGASRSGEGVEQDWNEAVDLYRRAVEQGHGVAMSNLGVCYEKGKGVERDSSKAVDLYRRAVDLGIGMAMCNLGGCYLIGEGVEQDWNKAVDLYQRAIKAGEDTAIRNIKNVLLLNFLGVGKYKTHENNGWLNRKLPPLKEAPVFDAPIMGGSWTQLSSEELTVYLDKVIAPLEIVGDLQSLNGYHGQYARLLPLKFYKECYLVDIQLYNPSNKNILIFSAIVTTKGGMLLNRESDIIYDLNPLLLTLENQKSVIDYLRFFCSYRNNEGKIFQIISDLNEIPFHQDASQSIQKIKLSFFGSRYIEGSFEREGWQKLKACGFYENALYDVTFKVFSDGRVSVENGECILEKLPILQRQYDGIFRSPLQSFN